ncbi:MAG: hypothetical protein ACR2OZ_09600 [Verrucomicrobiales bacterium]
MKSPVSHCRWCGGFNVIVPIMVSVGLLGRSIEAADVPPLDVAVRRASQVVIEQMRLGMNARDENARRLMWASQPGAIRTFSSSGGQLHQLYKLYSAPLLTATSAAEAIADVKDDWRSQPAHYVDLNASTTEANGSVTYPIADPRADAEGFSINGWTSESGLPMPVTWLYICRDGTVGSLDAANRFVPMLSNSRQWPRPASADNPIVSRIAFWTDDGASACLSNGAWIPITRKYPILRAPPQTTRRSKAACSILPCRL